MQSPQGFAGSLYELMPFPVIVTDLTATRCTLNEAGRRAFGSAQAEAASQSLSALLDEPDPFLLLHRLSLSQRNYTHALRFRRLDGSMFEAAAHVFALTADDGATGYALLLRTINDGGSHGEQVLLGSRVYSALDAVPEGLAIFDREERLLVFNRAFRDRCHPARDSVKVGATLESIVRANLRGDLYQGVVEGTPEAEAWVQSRLRHHRECGTPQVIPYNDGRWIRSESHVAQSGEVVAIRIDVTDLKRIEQALREKHRQQISFLQIFPDMLVRTDGDMVIQFANDQYAAFLGSTPAKLVGMSFWEAAGTDDRRETFGSPSDYTPATPLRTREICYTGADGQPLWLLWTAIASFEDGTAVDYLAVGRNITDSKLQHERLARQTLELQRKNEALNQFTATVSHDLKAPIRHIASFAEIIADEVDEGRLDELVAHASYMQQAASRMQKLVERLLEYSQIAYQIRLFETVSLTAVVTDALSMLEGHVREAEAEVDIGPLPAIRGDPELLRRLMQNLIGNAIKYRMGDAAPKVRVYSDGSQDKIRIVVEDKGIGIDPKHADRIFELFQRLHRDESQYAGTGIGLALAKRIVESHGGTIELDGDYRDGARFVVTLPRG
ncbi:ATP-binding protein [Rhizobium sp. ARZ01]|uniref:PAS domain-containing sensor histidine kinase n=1 Tax=Rhizobium sp. ARZ01 TaxID=2769313 RepID=UPI001FED67B7|nr:ATP-binding protein [Rhizobium sp. ARZ01]